MKIGLFLKASSNMLMMGSWERIHHTVRAANTGGTPVRDGKGTKYTKV
jgi:hypothetical protein